MKRVVFICLLMSLLLGLLSCSAPQEQENTESVTFSYEIQDPSLLRPQDRNREFFIETEDYYYYLYENKAYFSAKDDPTFYLLCGKPDCPHSGVDCDAYAGWALGWWNGKLYGVADIGTKMYLMSMNEDGSEHTAITDIVHPLSKNGTYGGSYFYFFNNGYLYYYILADPNAFFRVDLSAGETTRLMEKELSDGTKINERWYYEGDSIYMLLCAPSQERYLYRLCGEEAEKVCDWEFGIARWDIKGDMIYFYSAEYQAFCEYDLSTGTLTKKRDFTATYGAAYYDKEYIYLVTWDDYEGNRVIHFFDWNYQLLSEIELPNVQDLMYAAGDKFFFTGMPSNPITYYIPKSAIGTGELELIEVTNPYSYR